MLEFIELIRPNLGRSTIRSTQVRTRTKLSDSVAIPMPLVAYDLPWWKCPAEHARRLADQLDALGIAVSGLHSEFHQTGQEGEDPPVDVPLTICPYRPERYGLQFNDLASARIIDVRLSVPHNDAGLPRYTSEAMRRWDPRAARMADRAQAHYGGMQSMIWPADVADLEKLPKKVAQLRLLAPDALVCISIDAYRAGVDLQDVLRPDPEIVALRADRWPVDQAHALAEIVARTADLLRRGGQKCARLLLVPPPIIDEADVIKLLALGVDLVAIDPWCRDWIEPRRQKESPADWAAANLGVVTQAPAITLDPVDLAPLAERIERIKDWVEAVGAAGIHDLDRSYLAAYADQLAGVRSIITGVAPPERSPHRIAGQP